jgi:NADP-dependent 3-hydroxy acid dehydrogenase YdfG
MPTPRLATKSAGKNQPVVLITGSSQGIGAAIALIFAKEIPGLRLVLVARNAKNLQAVARRCVKAGAAAEAFDCDVSDEAAVASLQQAVTARYGSVDVLINNAGSFAGAPLTEMSVATFDRMIAANLRSVFLVTRAFVGGMKARRRGDIFNMSSIAGRIAYPGGAGYSAAKFGVSGLSHVMRAELREHGIRVCCVYPGATVSPSWDGGGVPAERMMPAEDVARAFLDIYRLSRRTVVEEIVLRPQLGDL